MRYAICFWLFLAANVSAQHIPKQPYIKHSLFTKDTITFYISETQAKTKLPLVVYIQGSGNSSLFGKMKEGSIYPRAGHISWYDVAKDRYRVLIIEKPGVHFTQDDPENKKFDALFSLESWCNSVADVIHSVLKDQTIDTSKMLVAGHSEGGLVAAAVTKKLGNLVTHTAIMAGEGPSQYYSLYHFAEEGVFFNEKSFSKQQRLDSLAHVMERIHKDPNSTSKKFWGFTYLRWSSFLSTSVSEQLQDCKGKVFIAQGKADKAVYPESANVLYATLLSKGKNVKLDMIPNADHSFSLPGMNGWLAEIEKVVAWFLELK
jgi:predicted esterase